MAQKRKSKERRAALLADNRRLRKLQASLGSRLDRLSSGLAGLEMLKVMGDMESLRMQMSLDTHVKFLATLSNLLRKMADEQAAMARALK